jgi:uncharacterized protein
MVRRLVAGFQPEQIILFGSYAWGEPTEDSDIDLFVIVPDSDERPINRMQRAHRCLIGMGLAKDILVKTRAEAERYRHVGASLEHKVFADGRVLYG